MIRPTPTLVLAALLGLGALPACDSQPPKCAGIGCPSPGPGEPDAVAGVDLNALFEAPTAAERDSVAARLARTGGTDAPRTASATTTTLAADADGTAYTLLTLRDAAGRTVTNALARTPAPGPSDPNIGRLPVLLILADGAGTASEADFLTGATAQGLDQRTVQVVVASRGATLTTRGVNTVAAPVARRSDLPADPYRADVLDVLALRGMLGAVPRADTSRAGVTGVGRGGAVALLAAERAPIRFRAVVPLSAPTSLFEATFRLDVRSALRGGTPGRLPAAEALVAPALALSRRQITLQEARLQMLELSAIALPRRLPPTHAYHTTDDDVVPLAHLARLREAVGLTTDPVLFDEVREVPHAGLLRDTTVRGLLADFMKRYLLGDLPS